MSDEVNPCPQCKARPDRRRAVAPCARFRLSRQISVWPNASSGSQRNPRCYAVKNVNRVALKLIRGVDHVRDILVDNTRRFASGLPANNTLLWGARGMGKSSLVKAVHADVSASL